MIKSHFLIAATIVLFASCSDGEAPKETNTAAPYQAAPVVTSDSTGASTDLQGAPQAPAGSAQPAAATGTPNPAHGEPGHRCDIPVGSPLSTVAAPVPAPQPTQPAQPFNAAPQPTFTTPVNVQPSSPAPGTATGKVNPAHGEPGHDCAVPVGSPLK